ncbi:MAG: GEVED domain-containing protein [Clostridium sp.]
MDQNSPDFLDQGVITVSGTIQTQFDWTFNPVDGKLHTTTQTIDLTTGAITQITYTPAIPGGIGAAFSDKDGFDYWLQNSTGLITRTELNSTTTGTSINFSKTVPASSNDGAACIYASLSPDFGDCPDSGTFPLSQNNYRSFLSKDGPRHATNSLLYFGNGVTQEPEALQNLTATGDSLDDGVTLPLPKLRISTKVYTVDITVTNKLGVDAFVYAWIDYDKNGIFSGDESADPLVVPSDLVTNPRNFKLIFNIPSTKLLTKGNTFLRMRITSVTLVNSATDPIIEDTRSYGVAEDGEVEDHLLEIGSNPQAQIEKFVDKSEAQLGEIIKYTLVVTNIGDIGISNMTVIDTLPSNSLFVSSDSGGQISSNGTNQILTLTNIQSLDTLQSYTITFYVKGVSLTPTNLLLNEGVLNFMSIDTGDTTVYSTESNIVQTLLKPLIPLEITKYVDKHFADLGETIHYTITLKNNNLVPSINNIFKDTIPYFTTFIPNSFTDNGVPRAGNPQFGIPVSDIPPLSVKTVTFDVLINQ